MVDERSAFEQILYDRLIPEFCGEARRGCDASGFQSGSVHISQQDAHYFLKAFNAGLIEHQGSGLYRAARSAAREQFFWEGRRALTPRPFTLWLEPIITVAGLARLHFDYGWPKHLIGTQSLDWAFDLVTFLPDRAEELIAGEVKKTAKEIDQLLQLMTIFGRHPTIEIPSSGKERNAYKKVLALRSRRPPLFWALGPDGVSEVFAVQYSEGGVVDLIATENAALKFASVD